MTAPQGSFTPVDIPAELAPRWERRFPGRLRWELDALQAAGVTPLPDPEALQLGQLVLTFDWPLDAQIILTLKAVYPDAFPYMRPEVFLLSGLDPLPVRHLHPLRGNLCLLGRDSDQWVPSWTLHRLLTEQLTDAIHGTGEEDPQGEPADFWWNHLGARGAYCLIDSSWHLGDAREGVLRLNYVFDGFHSAQGSSDGRRVPIVRSVISEISDTHNNIVQRWQGPLPVDLVASSKTLTMRWIRLGETILPRRDLGSQVEEVVQSHPWLQGIQPVHLTPTVAVQYFAIAHPVEIGFGATGLGWVLFQVVAHPHAFTQPSRSKSSKLPPVVTTVPTYRAGPTDVGHRVPAVRLLREKRIAVVGTGAVGAPVAIEVARNGCSTLQMIDYDTVEPGNTVRWPLGVSAWACPKPNALKGFLEREYPATVVHTHLHQFGGFDGRDDAILDGVLSEVDLVFDGSASHGVTALLADRCRQFRIPLISLFASPTLEGGAVVRYTAEGGCPNCLEHAWHDGHIAAPSGMGNEAALTQPPGCAERTFIGAGYDLQELSLQAVRLAVETLSAVGVGQSLVQTLSFIDENSQRCPPRWRVDALPKHPECRCR